MPYPAVHAKDESILVFRPGLIVRQQSLAVLAESGSFSLGLSL